MERGLATTFFFFFFFSGLIFLPLSLRVNFKSFCSSSPTRWVNTWKALSDKELSRLMVTMERVSRSPFFYMSSNREHSFFMGSLSGYFWAKSSQRGTTWALMKVT